MKKCFIILLKMSISFVLAAAILSLWCFVYYNPPVAVPQPDRYTNYRYQPNSWWSDMTEGYGWGIIDNIGYNNKENYDPSQKTIAFIGSSQLQAVQVPQDKNMISLTQKQLYNDLDPNNDYQCLNLGVSGHFFNISASNYEYFVKNFDNVDYVIMELDGLNYSAMQLDKIHAGGYHSDMEERGFLYKVLQKIPYFRLLVKQMQDLTQQETDTNTTPSNSENTVRQEKLDLIIKKLATLSEEHDIKLILLYHQRFTVNPDDTVVFNEDMEMENYLFERCDVYNIPVINMNQPMVDHYQANREFPYGFSNTSLNSGHLNAVGHELIAQSVYEEIVRQMRSE